jgi:hypothetical protein
MIVRLQVNDDNAGPHSDYRIGTIAENSSYYSSVNVSEIIAYNSVLSTSDAQIVENYLKNKWGIKNILDTTSFSNHGTGTPMHIASKFGSGIKFDGSSLGKSISGNISSLPGNAVTLSAWVYPESEDFYLFNADGLPVLHRLVCANNALFFLCQDWIRQPCPVRISMSSGLKDTFRSTNGRTWLLSMIFLRKRFSFS